MTTEKKMPVLFIGHGNPMNAIEENKYTLAWRKISSSIPKPEAILVISSHWATEGTGITSMPIPKTIHDLEDGFDDELFELQYPAIGNPELAEEIKEKVNFTDIVLIDREWGIDHGAWVVLSQMYPDADIPVLELSMDVYKPASYHYELGKELSYLRDKGVLILTTGNIVHNYTKGDFHSPNGAYPWARNFDEFIKNMILEGNHQALIDYKEFGEDALLSVPTPEHYYPLLYALGLQDEKDKISFPVEDIIFGSLSMRSVVFDSN